MRRGRRKDIGKKKMKKEVERFQHSMWDADSVQTRGKRGLGTARSTCHAVRKCIIINIKTRCFHSIRFLNSKTFDKVESTAGGLQFVLAYRVKNNSLNWEKNRANRHEDITKAEGLTVLHWDGSVFANDEWPAERQAVGPVSLLCKNTKSVPPPPPPPPLTNISPQSPPSSPGTTSFIWGKK